MNSLGNKLGKKNGHHYRTPVVVMTALLGTVITTSVSAGQPLGQLLATDDVTITSKGATFKVSHDVHPLFAGDQVVTEDNSVAVIRFRGDTGVVYSKQGSTTSFEKQGEDLIVTNTGDGEMRFSFKSGTGFRVLTSCYEITPVATDHSSGWTGGSVTIVDGVETVVPGNGEINIESRSRFDQEDGKNCGDEIAPAKIASVVANTSQDSGVNWLLGGGIVAGGVALGAASSDSSDSGVVDIPAPITAPDSTSVTSEPKPAPRTTNITPPKTVATNTGSVKPIGPASGPTNSKSPDPKPGAPTKTGGGVTVPKDPKNPVASPIKP